MEPKPLFIERMKKLLGNDFNNYEKILKILPVRSIRCNTLKISPEKLKTKLQSKGWTIKQLWKDYPEIMIVEGKFDNSKIDEKYVNKKGSEGKMDDKYKDQVKNSINNSSEGGGRGGGGIKLVDLEPGELGRALEHLLGYYYIQELSSMLPIIALNPKQNEIILDLCSAPGSKTSQLAAKMKNTGTIIANEISLGRIKILASNLERCGVTNTIITRKEGAVLCKRLKNRRFEFDKILIDAPCSGEGTLRSTPKTYLMWNIKTIKNLPKIQINLLRSALEILKPKGEIIYSTCTHAPEENEAVISKLLNEFKDIKIETIKLPIKFREGITKWENKQFNQEVKKCARIYPQDNNTEGFFIAKIRKLK